MIAHIIGYGMVAILFFALFLWASKEHSFKEALIAFIIIGIVIAYIILAGVLIASGEWLKLEDMGSVL